jgi:hypothetical protein
MMAQFSLLRVYVPVRFWALVCLFLMLAARAHGQVVEFYDLAVTDVG